MNFIVKDRLSRLGNFIFQCAHDIKQKKRQQQKRCSSDDDEMWREREAPTQAGNFQVKKKNAVKCNL